MTTRILPFVDVERLVVAHSKLVLEQPYRVVTDLPIPLDPALPLLQATATPGANDTEVTSYPRIDLSCYAATRPALWAATAASVELMRSLAGAEVGGQLVDTTVTVMRPYYLAWSPTVHRTIGTYEIQLRPRTASA